jgi:hypothetical protein
VNKPHAGQIGLCLHGKGWFSAVIHWITKSPANHVIIALDDKYCIGAESPGAIIRPVSHFKDVVWSDFKLTTWQRQHIVHWARRHNGVPYAWWTDIAIGVSKLLRTRAPKWLEDILASDGEYECAQLAQCAYLSAGIDLFDGQYRPGEVYPGSFVPVFKKNGWM